VGAQGVGSTPLSHGFLLHRVGEAFEVLLDDTFLETQHSRQDLFSELKILIEHASTAVLRLGANATSQLLELACS